MKPQAPLLHLFIVNIVNPEHIYVWLKHEFSCFNIRYFYLLYIPLHDQKLSNFICIIIFHIYLRLCVHTDIKSQSDGSRFSPAGGPCSIPRQLGQVKLILSDKFCHNVPNGRVRHPQWLDNCPPGPPSGATTVNYSGYCGNTESGFRLRFCIFFFMSYETLF